MDVASSLGTKVPFWWVMREAMHVSDYVGEPWYFPISFVINLKLFPQKEVLKMGGWWPLVCTCPSPVSLLRWYHCHSWTSHQALPSWISSYLFSCKPLYWFVYLSLRTKPLITYCDKCINDTFLSFCISESAFFFLLEFLLHRPWTFSIDSLIFFLFHYHFPFFCWF